MNSCDFCCIPPKKKDSFFFNWEEQSQRQSCDGRKGRKEESERLWEESWRSDRHIGSQSCNWNKNSTCRNYSSHDVPSFYPAELQRKTQKEEEERWKWRWDWVCIGRKKKKKMKALCVMKELIAWGIINIKEYL